MGNCCGGKNTGSAGKNTGSAGKNTDKIKYTEKR